MALLLTSTSTPSTGIASSSAILDLGRVRAEHVHQHLAGACHRDDVALVQDGVRRRLLDRAVVADAQHEDAGVRDERLGLEHVQAHRPASDRDAIGARFPAPPGRAGAAQFLDAALLLLVVLARGLEIDAEQLGAEDGDHHRRAHRAEHVGHRVGDRHRVEQRLGLFGGQAQPVDGVGRQAHRGGDRLRPGIESGRVPDVVAHELHDHDGDDQAERALDHREERLRQAVLGDAADELRPDAVADREQEHQEDRRLEGLVDGDPDLPDDDTGQQRRRDRPEADALEGELAEVVADRQREKDGDLRVLFQRRSEPIKHDLLRFVGDAEPAAASTSNQDAEHNECHHAGETLRRFSL